MYTVVHGEDEAKAEEPTTLEEGTEPRCPHLVDKVIGHLHEEILGLGVEFTLRVDVLGKKTRKTSFFLRRDGEHCVGTIQHRCIGTIQLLLTRSML